MSGGTSCARPPNGTPAAKAAEDKTMEKRTVVVKRDEEGVSPVIATILMVAITVVLAAVLYVMVSGLIGDGGGCRAAMGVNVGRSTDGSNWTLTVASTPSGKALTGTSLVIKAADGSIALAAAPLSTYAAAETDGVKYNKVTASATAVAVGDQVLIRSTLYLQGYGYSILDGSCILAGGGLRGWSRRPPPPPFLFCF